MGADPKDKHKWRSQDHTLNITGSKFYDFKELKGGGGAIDLVMYLEKCNFTEATHWLQDRFGEPATLQTVIRQTEEVISQGQQQPFIPPEKSDANWPLVREYLTRTRGLPAKLVDQLHQEGLVYGDQRQNAVFIRQSFEGGSGGGFIAGNGWEEQCFQGISLWHS